MASRFPEILRQALYRLMKQPPILCEKYPWSNYSEPWFDILFLCDEPILIIYSTNALEMLIVISASWFVELELLSRVFGEKLIQGKKGLMIIHWVVS